MSAYIAATFSSCHPSPASEQPERPSFDASKNKNNLDTSQADNWARKGSRRPYIVDVGAGQGYLSRALAAYGFHVLALDRDENQTKGSLARTDWLDSTTAAVGERRKERSKGRESDEPKEVTNEQGSKTTDIDATTTSAKRDTIEIGKGKEEDLKGSVSNRTVFIDDADALTNTINEWIQEHDRSQTLLPQHGGLFPIVVVGLHACGDLTPAILSFIRRQLSPSQSNSSTKLFELVGCVVVGCCYNMMTTSSFPLSNKLASELSICRNADGARADAEPFRLDTQHLHLAAQAPKTWSLETPPAPERANLPFEIPSSTALSMRKIAYRALLARRLPVAYRAETQSKSDSVATADRVTRVGEEWPPNLDDVDWRTRRIGRLATSVYKDFPTFLKAARIKLGIAQQHTFSSVTNGVQPLLLTREGDMESDLCPYETELVQKIQVFQVLRCFLGPLVESLLVLDRYWFLFEAVHSALSEQPSETLSGRKENVQLINLFDQSTGSLRNTALVWKV